MQRAAAEVAKTLRKKLIQAAYQNPAIRQETLAAVEKLAGQDKVAISEATEAFRRWAISTQAPMSPGEVESFVNRQLGKPTMAPVTKRPGARFQKGDSVEIKKDKHKDARFDIGPYQLYNGKIGTVSDSDGMDVLVSFPGQTEPVRFPGGQSAKGVGIYAYKEMKEVVGSQKFEMVYLADPTSKATDEQIRVVEVYVSRGRTEKRPTDYYTGFASFASTSKEGQFYFKAQPQQRMRIDPAAEAGYEFRTFNPTKGKVFYIGLFGKRPSNWEEQLEDFESKMGGSLGEGKAED